MDFTKKDSRIFSRKSLVQRIILNIKRARLKSLGRVTFGENLMILGGLPICKTPREGMILIGDNVTLNSDKLHSNSALTSAVKLTTGYNGVINIGNNSILNGSCIVAYDKVDIGSCCEIASCTIITDTDFHPVDPGERLKQMKGDLFSFDTVNKKPVKIGNNCWIGYGAIILKGYTIGNNCIVGAGAVIPGNSSFPDNCVIAGNPAKIVKMLK